MRRMAGPVLVSELKSGRPQAADSTSQLERLAALHDRGVLTDAEFADQKSALLGAH